MIPTVQNKVRTTKQTVSLSHEASVYTVWQSKNIVIGSLKGHNETHTAKCIYLMITKGSCISKRDTGVLGTLCIFIVF